MAGKARLLRVAEEMYGDIVLSDATLVVGGDRIPVHRNVLAAHSSVFRTMWHHTDLLEVIVPRPFHI